MSTRTATQLRCPDCEEIEPCSSEDFIAGIHGQGRQLSRLGHPDLHFFRRRRVCEACAYEFFTVEIEESFLEELVSLRNLVGELRVKVPELANGLSKTAKLLGNVKK